MASNVCPNTTNTPKFLNGATKLRIYLIDTVRKNASKIFALGPAITVDYYAKDYDRSTIPRFVELLQSPKNPGEQFAMYPRVLFTNYEFDETQLFGSPAILNVSPSHPLNLTRSSQHPLDLKINAPRTKFYQLHRNSEVWPEGKGAHLGAQVHHSWLHRVGSCRCKLSILSSDIMLILVIQAQFIISPDRAFSETGAISRVDYRDRFNKYKKFIIKHADTPRMRRLVAQLEKDFFQVHSPDSLSSAGEPEAIDEEEEFCLAFQNDTVISDPIPTSPILAPSLVEPTTPLPDPDVPSTLPPTTLVEPPAVLNSEEEPTNTPAPATKKKPRKKNGEDGPATAANNRRSARNGGGTVGMVVGGKATKG